MNELLNDLGPYEKVRIALALVDSLAAEFEARFRAAMEGKSIGIM